MTYYAQTMPGVEEIAWLEIRDRLKGSHFLRYLFAKDQNGIVVFDYKGNPADLLNLRATEDVFWQAAFVEDLARTHRDLARIGELLEKGEEVGRVINDFMRFRRYAGPPTYRVITRQYGKFGYPRYQVTNTVVKALKARLPRWTPVADDAQVEFWVNLLGSQLLVGIRLSDRGMRHRFERKVELPASLRPSVAAAMVLLTGPEAGDVFMDPMCGSGTILFEREKAGPYGQILGGDVVKERAEAAKKNLARPGRGPDKLLIRTWDARQLPLDAASVDKVATNLPFGQQIKGPAAPERLYPPVLAELERVVRPGGRIILLSSQYELVKEEVRKRPRLTISTGYSMAILGKWGRIYIIEVS
jgi:precorrin-6B methylase 2